MAMAMACRNVRAMNYATLQMVQQRDDDTAEVCYLVQSDLRGTFLYEKSLVLYMKCVFL